MQKDSCCSGVGLCKWCCPSLVSIVAGIIMFAAGTVKLYAGKAMLSGVGGMALGLVGIEGHARIALGLGLIAAIIEIFGGISFGIGCKKTSKYAALFLSLLMGIILLIKLTNLESVDGGLYIKLVAVLQQIQLDLLLFAIFFQKALKLIKCWCGMGCCSGAIGCCSGGNGKDMSCCKTECCTEAAPKKKSRKK